LLFEAIKPAVPKNARVDSRRIYFEVAEKDLAVAIGKHGLNAKRSSA
jgi:transcription antitermination factor NusA-like protein